MSLSPVSVAPAPAPGAAPSGSAGATNPAQPPGDFLAAIQAAMSQAAPTPDTVVPVPVTPVPVAAVPAAPVPAAPAPGTVPADGTAATQAPLPVGTPVGEQADPDPAAADQDADATDVPEAAPADPALAAVIAQTGFTPVLRVDKVEGPKTHPSSGRGPVAATATQATVPDADTAAAPTAPDLAPAAVVPSATGTAALTPDASSSQQNQQPAISAIAPAAATSATTAPAANTTPLDKVAAQVFPEVTSLVSKGSGTHRLTLTLNPAQLGEVRIVMTMRDGSVHVRMAAGHEARVSLLDGSPELARLLEQAGATTTKIVVRELPAAAALDHNFPPSTGTGQQPGSGEDRSPDQRAGTHADHPAKDGYENHGRQRTAPATAVRPTQSVFGTRPAGVDLTM